MHNNLGPQACWHSPSSYYGLTAAAAARFRTRTWPPGAGRIEGRLAPPRVQSARTAHRAPVWTSFRQMKAAPRASTKLNGIATGSMPTGRTERFQITTHIIT